MLFLTPPIKSVNLFFGRCFYSEPKGGVKMSVLIAQITFNRRYLEKTEICTNAKKGALIELLSDFLRDKMDWHKDEESVAKRDQFSVEIRLNLENDSFSVKSDAGDNSLTYNVVASTLKMIDEVAVRPINSEVVAG